MLNPKTPRMGQRVFFSDGSAGLYQGMKDGKYRVWNGNDDGKIRLYPPETVIQKAFPVGHTFVKVGGNLK